MRGRIHHRTIPTRVGSTSTFHFRCPSDSDHPHVGGEHDLQNGEHVKERGPSPRGWGAPRSVPLSITQPRTIPARGGSTIIKKCVQGLGTDHPHAGGGHCIKFHPGTPNIGPSPPGAGGSTIRKKCVQGLGTDHPHAGGEHCIKFHPGTRNIGPSPRGWGALWIDRDLRRHLLISLCGLMCPCDVATPGSWASSYTVRYTAPHNHKLYVQSIIAASGFPYPALCILRQRRQEFRRQAASVRIRPRRRIEQI